MACQDINTQEGLSEYRSSSRNCQNTAIVVGDHAVELERYYLRKKVICNDFFGSAIVICLFLVLSAVLAQVLTPHVG